ncbi:MAG: hypothetical protein LBL48_03715 [Azoarcus sp.]|jgi:hypothetical protein|nr:hypothetical protein [Azoarcus sp.]
MSYTARQLHLFYREACALDAARMADVIVAVNAGFAGGSGAQRLVKSLRREG